MAAAVAVPETTEDYASYDVVATRGGPASYNAAAPAPTYLPEDDIIDSSGE